MFKYKKDIKSEFPTIKNLFYKINSIIFFYFKLLNSILNYGDSKTNYRHIKKLKYIPSTCYYFESDFIILKKIVLNSLNNNSCKKPF